MDSLPLLSDQLVKSSSLLDGLLSQINGAFAAGAQASLFSTLLSDNGGNSSALALLTQSAATTTPNFSSQNSASFSSSSPSSSLDQIVQSVSDLSGVLHQILNLLHQQNNGASSSGNSASNNSASPNANTQNAQTATTPQSGQTQSASNAPQNDAQTPVTTVTGDTGNNNDSQSSDSPAQTLAGIISELLLLTQLVLQKLQQMPQTVGADISQTAAAGANDIALTLGAVDGQTNSGDTGTAPASDPSANANPIMQLLQAIEQNAKQLLDDKINIDSGANDVVQNNGTPLLAAGVDTTQLAQLGADLKTALTNLQQQLQAAPLFQAASAAPQILTPLPDTTPKTQPPVAPLNKPATDDDLETQSFAASSPQSSASSQDQTPVVAAAFVATGNTDGNAGADLTSGGNNFAFTGNIGNIGANQSTGGTQAVGTYNFASTLSAFRADNGGTVGLPPAIDQVILQLSRSVKSGDSQMTVQLQPADLGKITVRLSIASDGKVQGTVTATNPQTLALLEKDSRSLERALQDAGLRADPGSLQFNLGGQGGGTGQAANDANGTAGDSGDGTLAADDGTELADINAVPETYYITPGGVDIRV